MAFEHSTPHLSGLHFTKMHSLGNDFMVIDATKTPFMLTREDIQRLSHRHTGVGFDQCLVLEPPKQANADFYYRIFNANGSEVGQCVNGIRCIARFIEHYELLDRPHTDIITLDTYSTRMQLAIHEDKTVTAYLPPPSLDPLDIPITASEQAELYTLKVDHESSYRVHAIHVGNPHAIMFVSHLEPIDLATLGKSISEHPFFPEHTNVSLVEVSTPNAIQLRVYERGCGETKACGSAAAAAVAVGRLYHKFPTSVTVHQPGGTLDVHWPSFTDPIALTGPVNFVYEGVVF